MLAVSKTPRFTTLMFGAVFMYLVAILFGLPSQFFMAAALLIAPAVSYVLAAYGLMTVTGERRVPERLWPDEQAAVEVRVSNQARLPKALLLIDERLPDGLEHDADTPAGFVVPMLWSEPFIHRYPMVARHRGRYRLPPLTASAVDTFDLFRARRVIGPGNELLVYPRVLPLRDHAVYNPALGGRLQQRRPLADGTDFRATREYKPGDDLRRMHWRSTARQSKPIVMEFEEPATTDLFVVLDVSSLSVYGQGRDTTLETGVTAAASVIAHELELGNAVGLLLDGAESVQINLTSERQDLLELLEALAVVEADGRQPFAMTLATLAARLPRGVQVLALSAAADDALLGALGGLVRRNYGVTFGWLDPAGYPDVPEAVMTRNPLPAAKALGMVALQLRRGAVVRGLAEPL